MSSWRAIANAVRTEIEGQEYADAATEGNSPYKDTMFLRWAQDFVDQWSNRVQIEESTTNTINLVADTSLYSLPSDFLSIKSVVYVNPTDSTETQIGEVDVDASIKWAGVSTTELTPEGWALWGYGDTRQIKFIPTPGSTGTVRLRYYRLITRPTAITDTADVANEWVPAVKEWFKWQISHDVDQQPSKAVSHERRFYLAVKRARSMRYEYHTGGLSWR